MLVLAELLLNDDNLATRIDTYSKLLKHFSLDNAKAQKYLLYGLEPIFVARPALAAKIASILHKLYENDVVEEEAFFAWFEKVL